MTAAELNNAVTAPSSDALLVPVLVASTVSLLLGVSMAAAAAVSYIVITRRRINHTRAGPCQSARTTLNKHILSFHIAYAMLLIAVSSRWWGRNLCAKLDTVINSLRQTFARVWAPFWPRISTLKARYWYKIFVPPSVRRSVQCWYWVEKIYLFICLFIYLFIMKFVLKVQYKNTV